MAERPSHIVRVNSHDIVIQYLGGFAINTDTDLYPRLRKKLWERDELAQQCELLRQHGVRIAFTTGVFDMTHIGHARYLELARTLGDVLVVGLNSDSSVKRLKGPNRPIQTEQHRAEMLSFLEQVDYITIFSETDGSAVIKAIKPDAYLCVEGSWEGDIETKAEVIAMAQHGGEVYYASRQAPTLSTTAIITRIEELHADRLGLNLSEDFREIVRGGNTDGRE